MSTNPKPLRQPGLIVYLCGLATSTLVLFGVYWANNAGTNIMGWYFWGVIPVGALLVGVASGLGYAVGSRLLHVKLSEAFVIGMLATAVVDYIAAQYLTYTQLIELANIPPERYSFVDYVRDQCETMSFTGRHSNRPGAPLGFWGYLFKFLEMAGYAIGAAVPSLIVSGMPYCKACQAYLKAHRTGYLRSTAFWAEIEKLGKKDRQAALEKAVAEVCTRASEIVESARTASLADTEALLARLDPKTNLDEAAHVDFKLLKCPTCDAHHLTATLTNYTVDKKMADTEIALLDKTQAPAAPIPSSQIERD